MELEFSWFNQIVVFPDEQQIEEQANWTISRELGYNYCHGLVTHVYNSDGDNVTAAVDHLYKIFCGLFVN